MKIGLGNVWQAGAIMRGVRADAFLSVDCSCMVAGQKMSPAVSRSVGVAPGARGGDEDAFRYHSNLGTGVKNEINRDGFSCGRSKAEGELSLTFTPIRVAVEEAVASFTR